MLVKLNMYGLEKTFGIPDSTRPPKELTIRLYKPMPRFVKFTGDACSSVNVDDIWLDVHFRLDVWKEHEMPVYILDWQSKSIGESSIG